MKKITRLPLIGQQLTNTDLVLKKYKMKDWNVEFDYTLRHGGAMTFQAETRDEAEQMGYEYVRDTFDDAIDIEIVEVDEIKK